LANSKLKAGAKDWAVCPICREKWVDCQHTVQQILDGVFAQGKLAEKERIWKAYVDFIVEVEGQVEMIHIRTEDEIEDFMRFQCGHPRLKSQLKEVD